MRSPRHLFHMLSRWAILTVLLAGGLFLAAGTTHVTMLRAYVSVFSAMLLFTMLAVDPGLARERARPSCCGNGARARFASGFLFLVTVSFAAADVGRLHQSDSVPTALSLISLFVFAAALGFQAWAMIVNPFFSPELRIQGERWQHVITAGPYRWLRHPGYLAMAVAIPASALAIGSWLALIPAAGFCLIIARRACLEGEFLKHELPGYSDYMQSAPNLLLLRRANLRVATLYKRQLAILVSYGYLLVIFCRRRCVRCRLL